jgi:hypothetical protein
MLQENLLKVGSIPVSASNILCAGCHTITLIYFFIFQAIALISRLTSNQYSYSLLEAA